VRFLLVDKIIELKEGKSAVGVKNISLSEDYLADHFPSFPIVPGVLILESLAQLSGKLINLTVKAERGISVLPVLSIVYNAKFRKFVRPGDQLRLDARLDSLHEESARVTAKALVGDHVVATAEMMFAFDAGHRGQGEGYLTDEQKQRLMEWADDVNRVLLRDVKK
jgi:3-hydroxyacyl-[acyl-carrier-protein] dehydratase